MFVFVIKFLISALTNSSLRTKFLPYFISHVAKIGVCNLKINIHAISFFPNRNSIFGVEKVFKKTSLIFQKHSCLGMYSMIRNVNLWKII